MVAPAPFQLLTPSGPVVLPCGDFVIGRSASCDLALSRGTRIGKRHAVLRVAPDRTVLEDLGSGHGTRINGRPLHLDLAVLREGDVLAIGVHRFIFGRVPANPGHRRSASSGTYARSRTAGEGNPDSAGAATDVLITSIDTALAAGQVAEASSALRGLLLSVRAALLRRRHPGPHVIATVARVCLDVAEHSGEPSWVERLLDTYAAAGDVPSETVIARIVRWRTAGLLPDRVVEAFRLRLMGRGRGLDDRERVLVDRLVTTAA